MAPMTTETGVTKLNGTASIQSRTKKFNTTIVANITIIKSENHLMFMGSHYLVSYMGIKIYAI